MKAPFHILIIEDNPDDCADIRQMLLRGSDVHYRFTEASTGEAGLRACREVGDAAPDLVLLDFYLPDIDATDVLAGLRNGKDLLPFPVIVLTGTDRQVGPQMLQAGAQDFLGKSWATPESLTRAVENATERWAMSRKLRSRSEALQSSQQQLQLAVEVAGLAVNRVDYTTNTVVLDTLAAALFGLKAGVPLPRQAIHDTFHPDDKNEIFQLMNRSLDPTGDGWFVMEHRVIHPDGSTRWLSVKKRVEFGEVNGIRAPMTGLLAAIDITARKQAEDALRESQQFISRVLDYGLTAFVGVTTPDGTVTYANRSALEAAGIPASEVFGKKFWDCHWWSYSPEIQAQLRDAFERAASGEIVRYDVPVRMAGETRKWIDFQVAPLRDTEGRITHLIPAAMEIEARHAAEEKMRTSEGQMGTMNEQLLISSLHQHELRETAEKLNEQLQAEIREREQVEDALRVSEERFRVAALAVSNLIWTNTAQGMMEGEQPAWAQFTGQTPEEYQGHGWAKAVHPDDAQPTIEAWNAAVAEKRLFEFEHRVRRRDGAWRSCSIRAVPIIGGDGEVREWVGVHNDITELKQSSAALLEAKEHAEAASQAKDNFLAALSHELRTPLTPVLMTATALASDPSLPAEAREQLDMMRSNIELEARLIDDLLDLTRIIHGKLMLTPVTADIHELLLQADEIVRSDGLSKQLLVTLRLDAAQHHALVDPARLQQVFWNLLRNAVKFTPDGGIITVNSRNDAEGRIIVNVEDDGIGIRAEVLSKIFNAFEQADATGEHRYGGLGLGLAISSAIVTAHGGEIKAESQGRGRGANFTVTLNSVPAPAADSQKNAMPAQPVRALSLLVVEDHEATRTVLKRLLTRSGHLVTTAATVQDALTTYRAAHFDAVISDLGLPDGSGIELMVQIQSIRPVPAIALSGYGMEDDLQRSKDAGFFAHLVKPVKVDQLTHFLTQLPSPTL